jgi:hypothetical protein
MKIFNTILLALFASTATALSEGGASEKEVLRSNAQLPARAPVDSSASGSSSRIEDDEDDPETDSSQFWGRFSIPESISGLAAQLQERIVKIEWQELSEQAKQALLQRATETRDAVYAVKWEDLPENAKQYVKDHPYQTAFLVVEGLVYISPGAANMFLFRMLGFGPMGPKAGKEIPPHRLCVR